MPNNINHKQEDDLTTEEKVALEGKPRLGAIPRVQINIRESDEFKVSHEEQVSIVWNICSPQEFMKEV